MKLMTRQYQHYKGGCYHVYGEVRPLPETGYQTTVYRFIAVDTDSQQETGVLITDKGIFFESSEGSSMVLYKSPETDGWWLRPFHEFHGSVIADGKKTKRFTLSDERQVFYADVQLAPIE